MVLEDLLRFENPEFISIVLGLLLFIIVFTVLQKFRFQKGIAVIIAIIAALMSIWYSYREGYIYDASFMSGVFTIVAIAFVLMIMKSFFRFGKSQFR